MPKSRELKPLPPSLLLPTLSLVAHSAEHRRPQGILSDPTAEAWFNALASVYSGIPNPEPELINGIITRSIVIDYAVLAFLAAHQRVIVSDLGCGFSTRFKRLGLSQCQVQLWAHLDLPSVLQTRCAFGPMSAIELAIGHDLCDPRMDQSLTSRGQLASTGLFILEGVLNHLAKEVAANLISHLHEHWQGHTIIGTVMTTRALDGLQSLSEALGTPFPAWGVQSYSELVGWLKPAHIERVWLLGKVSSRLGLIRPLLSDEAAGLVFKATL